MKMNFIKGAIIALVALSTYVTPLSVEPHITEPPKPPEQIEQEIYLCTGYCNCSICTDKSPGDVGYGITASGHKTSHDTIASDLPLGTILHIQGIGTRIVQDRGGAVSGKHIDIWFPTHEQALQFGTRYLPVERR